MPSLAPVIAFLFVFGPHVVFLALLVRAHSRPGSRRVRASWWLGMPLWILVAAVVITPATAPLVSIGMWGYLVTATAAFILVPLSWRPETAPKRSREGRWSLGLWLGTHVHLWIMLAVAPQFLEPLDQIATRNRLMKLGLGIGIYRLYQSRLPARYEVDAQGRPARSWRVTLLPFIDPSGRDMLVELDAGAAWDAPSNQALSRRHVPALVCPRYWEPPTSAVKLDLLFGGRKLRSHNAEGYGVTHYVGAAGPHAAFRAPGHRPLDVRLLAGGQTGLLIAGEAVEADIPWSAPIDLVIPGPGGKLPDPMLGFSSPNAAGCHFLALDGSVHFIPATTTPDMLAQRLRVRSAP